MATYSLRPVGYLEQLDNGQELFINDDYKPALLHVNKFSHIIILWLNRDRENFYRKIKTLSEQYYNCFQNLGSQSPVEVSVARVKSIDEANGSIRIDDIIIPNDATILDLKPYFPIEDRVQNFVIPDDLSNTPNFFQSIKSKKLLQALRDRQLGNANQILDSLEIDQSGSFIKKQGHCQIKLFDASSEFLESLGLFSHIQILWWFNRFEKESYRKTTQCNPPYEKAPRTGVFATRSPVRPNPIALTTARILKIDRSKKILSISSIDAFDKTPIIDVKPYIPFLNRVKTFSVPNWLDHWSEWFEEEEEIQGNNIALTTTSDFERLGGLLSPREPALIEEQVSTQDVQADEASSDFIVIKGARENNLQGISLKIPKNKLTVITGLSGSGKSSLAFDTLYAESQRRFMDSISASGRQIFKQFERPAVDQVLNLPPAIAVEQKSVGRNSRSSVGTASDISDYMRLLFAKVGVVHCPKCGRAVEKKSVHQILQLLTNLPPGMSFGITLMDSNQVDHLYTVPEEIGNSDYKEQVRTKVEQILEAEKGALKVITSEGDDYILHTRNHCYYCGVSFFDLTPSFFSNNNPESMCPNCDGLGTKMSVSPERIVSKPEKSLLDSASEWWGDLRKFLKNPTGNWMKGEVIALAQSVGIDLETPWKDLPSEFQKKALFGTDGEIVNLTFRGTRGRDGNINRPVEGAVNHIKRLFSNSHEKNSSEFYLQFIQKEECPACHGEQLNPVARFVTVAQKRFPEVSAMSIDSLQKWMDEIPEKMSNSEYQLSKEIIQTIGKKAKALIDVGLHYLSLNRQMPTLSGGEAQRLRLATQLGCGLTNLLYILDEPSVGLHHSDHDRLIETMKQLRDMGNTLVVVEHNTSTMLQADHLIDIGPGAGIKGGHIVAQGKPSEVMAVENSMTGKYLNEDLFVGKSLPKKQRKPQGYLKLTGACKNNLKNVTVKIPLAMFVCITGKSGSGKSSLITDTLSPLLAHYYNHGNLLKGDYEKIEGVEKLNGVISITQEAIGRTPRSNPATYTGLFDEIRNIFASTDQAQQQGYTSSRFSFNSKEGRCEACEGEGRKRVEMNFMPDVWITCSECHGKRFNNDTLQITYKDKTIADVLEMDINEATAFFTNNKKAAQILMTLQDVGLGYIKLGQSALTLSGGEAQRVKLAKQLSKSSSGKTLYILDEPTTGLHFNDIEHLLNLLHRITEAGNTVIVVEHNVDLIRNADWIIDLGPEGGEKGGYLIAAGTSKEVLSRQENQTGAWLKN
ncbi:excinuclease ABC subunit UvrA [bacterium]|nr:excinuclease ABC subunit UvrA [bacterium]